MVIKCAVEYTLRCCGKSVTGPYRKPVLKREVHEWKYELEKVTAKSGNT